MGNRLYIGLASFFLLFCLIQGMPLDPRSPLERAVLEKRQQNLCPDDAHPAAKHYHTSYCAKDAGSIYKTKRAECIENNRKVRLYCGVPNSRAEVFQDIPCDENEFCKDDDGRNCLEEDHQHMAACVVDFIPNNIDPLHRCYITQHIEIATGAVLLHAHTSGTHANWKDQHSGVAHPDVSYFDEQLYGPTYVDLRVVSPCLTTVYYSLFKGI
ncbi:uncharacterized protein J3D65DRAFT_675208 [Phyllosticta citribraziliensis]|uniref:Uncharacterized protein n=1 Tax=Phyllosticta citribraziliensis TaxID=989973 RepID=A0ABR1M2N8_9PEZI